MEPYPSPQNPPSGPRYTELEKRLLRDEHGRMEAERHRRRVLTEWGIVGLSAFFGAHISVPDRFVFHVFGGALSGAIVGAIIVKFWRLWETRTGRGDASALKLYEDRLEAAERIGDESWIAHTLVNIALVYEHQGRQRDALNAIERAFAIGERLGINRASDWQRVRERINRRAERRASPPGSVG
jgi:hypothetical protein